MLKQKDNVRVWFSPVESDSNHQLHSSGIQPGKPSIQSRRRQIPGTTPS
jgi:hypothetical protein